MFRRFTEASAEIDHAASKVEANTGEAVRTPNLWKAATREARARATAHEPIAVPKERFTSTAGLPAPPA